MMGRRQRGTMCSIWGCIVVLVVLLLMGHLLSHFWLKRGSFEQLSKVSMKNFRTSSSVTVPSTHFAVNKSAERGGSAGILKRIAFDKIDSSLKMELPSITIDNSELILASLIERSFSSSHHMTTFFLNPSFVLNERNRRNRIIKIDSSFIDKWTEVVGRMYRIQESHLASDMHCRIYDSENMMSSYTVKGQMLSQPSSGIESVLSVLRCPMRLETTNGNVSKASYLFSNKSIPVDIFRGNGRALARFFVPFKFQYAGHAITPVKLTAKEVSKQSRKFRDQSNELNVHICISGMKSFKSAGSALYHLAEFIEYYLLLGVNHFYLPVDKASNSIPPEILCQALDKYKNDGLVTIFNVSSHSNSILGLKFHRSVVDLLLLNSCLYQAKGSADFVGFLNIMEYIVPVPPAHSISSIINEALVKFSSISEASEGKVMHTCSIRIDRVKKYLNTQSYRLREPSRKVTQKYSFSEPIFKESTSVTFFSTRSHMATVDTCYGEFNVSEISIRLNFEGYLYELVLEDSPASVTAHKRRMMPFTDKVAVSLLQRAEYIVDQKIATLAQDVQEVHATDDGSPKKNWMPYGKIFKPQYETMSLMNSPEVKHLDQKDRIRHTSHDGYIKFEEKFTLDDSSGGPLPGELPLFATDLTEVALGAVIERKSNSWDLYVTTFLLHHDIVNADEGYGLLRISNENRETWKRVLDSFARSKYSKQGIREIPEGEHFRCRLKHSKSHMEYVVTGEFVPSRLSTDSNSNNKLDILRCKMKDSKNSYMNLINSDEEIHVSVLGTANNPLFQYSLPWRSRRSGYLLSCPSAVDSFSPWAAFLRDSSTLPGKLGAEKVHMSVPGMESPISQESLPKYLEFMQHHFSIGVDHMFAAGSFSWNSLMMSNLIMATKSFVSDGLLTLNSQAGDNINLLNSVLGASFDRDVIKVFYINMCLYLAKGTVNYMAVWDIDEYFIPRSPHNNIMTVIKEFENAQSSQVYGESGMHDRNKSSCFFGLESEVILSSLGYPEEFDQRKPWVGYKYPHQPELSGQSRYAFAKSIIPTSRVFQAGLHMHGACQIIAENTHIWEPKVLKTSVNAIPPVDAVIYHFQMYRAHAAANASLLTTKNEYTERFFPSVLKELRKRGLNVLVTLPDNAPVISRADIDWLPINSILPQQDATASEDRLQPDLQVEHHFLPTFSSDGSEMVLGAVIERSFESAALYVTVFMLSHRAFSSGTLAKLSPMLSSNWSRLRVLGNGIRYSSAGRRKSRNNFHCLISNVPGANTYKVKGHFIPNRLTVDSNANGKLDVLRCPIRRPKQSLKSLSLLNMTVEITRESETPLVKFLLPWKTRRIGYLLSSPVSRLDMWRRGGGSRDRVVHMCVPGFESPMSKKSLAIFAEFLQHHYNMGVEHIHAATRYKWGEFNMNAFVESFQSYVDEEMLSVVSSSEDVDGVAGWLGLSMDRDVIKVIFVNMCLYLSKGMVDYLAVWDIDEYFVPKLPYNSIADVIRSVESSEDLTPLPGSANAFELVDTWKGGQGWADGDGHPFCYLRLLSRALFRSKAADSASPWVGVRFTQSPEIDTSFDFEKVILPTRKIFQAGLHSGGACKLSYPFTGCSKNSSKEFCNADTYAQLYGRTIVRGAFYNSTDFSFEQRFDSFVFAKDAKTIDPANKALLYHIQVHRKSLVSENTINLKNDYVQLFYPRVLQDLRRKGLELNVILPGKIQKFEGDLDSLMGWRNIN